MLFFYYISFTPRPLTEGAGLTKINELVYYIKYIQYCWILMIVLNILRKEEKKSIIEKKPDEIYVEHHHKFHILLYNISPYH